MSAKQIAASHEIEELAAEVKDLVNELRSGDLHDAQAYQELYDLRTRLGRVVATLGAGKPKRSNK